MGCIWGKQHNYEEDTFCNYNSTQQSLIGDFYNYSKDISNYLKGTNNYPYTTDPYSSNNYTGNPAVYIPPRPFTDPYTSHREVKLDSLNPLWIEQSSISSMLAKPTVGDQGLLLQAGGGLHLPQNNTSPYYSQPLSPQPQYPPAYYSFPQFNGPSSSGLELQHTPSASSCD